MKKLTDGCLSSSLCVVVEVLLLLGLYLHDRVHEVLVRHYLRLPPQRDHAGLHAHSLALSPVEVVGRPGELVEVNVGADVHLARVDLHDASPRLLRRRRELDLPVEAAGPEKGWVKDVDPVGGCDDLDVGGGAEPVQLVEQLKYGTLHLSVTGLFRVKPLGSDGVQLVDEDDGGRLLLRQSERVAHQLGAVTPM